MATKLNKKVKRELSAVDRKGRPIIMTIEPGDILTFRPKGLKRSVSVYAGQAFMLAQLMTIEREYSQKLKDYNVQKKAGKQFLRKPRKPFVPFGKIFYDATK